MTNYHEVFINNLRNARRECGLTQAQLAERCGVSNGTIGNIECGTTKPSFDLIMEIARALSTPPHTLFIDGDVQIAATGTIGNDDADNRPFTRTQLGKIRAAMHGAIDSALKLL